MSAINGPATWLTLALLLSGGFGLALLFFASARISHRYPTSDLGVHCPATGKDAACTGIYDRTAGRWINVASCPEPGFPQCDRACLRRFGASQAT
jgi:hypothetical protein